jgi:superfamily II DNA or RNA helicase
VRIVPVTVDSHLRLDGNLVGHDIANQIFDELTVPNPEALYVREKRPWLAVDVPEDFLLADLDGDTVVMARGYAYQLRQLLLEHDLGVQWIDHRSFRRGAPLGHQEFSYRAHQPAAVRAIRRHQQLIYKAPTGSGKTVTVCGAIWEMSPQRSIILVDRVNLIDQWMDRIEEHIGIPRSQIGNIGDNKWTEGRITVATVQTLHRNIDFLRKINWFAKWSFMCLDECHHVTARTFLELVTEFPARIRMGTSATPDKTGAFELALNTLGEVAYETTQEELRSYGLLVEPEVRVVPTPFEFTYWGDHKSTKKGQCEVPNCPNVGKKHGHRNNYMKLGESICVDDKRNELIVENIVDNFGETQLIITDRLAQIHALVETLSAHPIYGHDQGIGPEDVFILTGKQKRKERAALIELIESQKGAIIFSTIAGEALDIPIISRIHLVFPTRNPRKTEQNVGRGSRQHDDKTDTIIFDYTDFKIGVLYDQFKTRQKECYTPLGFTVKIPPSMNGQRATLGSGRMKV